MAANGVCANWHASASSIHNCRGPSSEDERHSLPLGLTKSYRRWQGYPGPDSMTSSLSFARWLLWAPAQHCARQPARPIPAWRGYAQRCLWEAGRSASQTVWESATW